METIFGNKIQTKILKQKQDLGVTTLLAAEEREIKLHLDYQNEILEQKE